MTHDDGESEQIRLGGSMLEKEEGGREKTAHLTNLLFLFFDNQKWEFVFLVVEINSSLQLSAKLLFWEIQSMYTIYEIVLLKLLPNTLGYALNTNNLKVEFLELYSFLNKKH